ncbi:hypothetical protein [Pelagicoccus mobilis]|uniref:Uncharacterized protein n=1 Tax=Pelagicoccus mobilis TaxID=415221 RepID=A0A934VSS1_9BACT|nr:hypothetical protein [Pelagicoccus mobilis]MBK1880717.1 hypothetical protein [Pelagicoccus mobilis]
MTIKKNKLDHLQAWAGILALPIAIAALMWQITKDIQNDAEDIRIGYTISKNQKEGVTLNVEVTNFSSFDVILKKVDVQFGQEAESVADLSLLEDGARKLKIPARDFSNFTLGPISFEELEKSLDKLPDGSGAIVVETSRGEVFRAEGVQTGLSLMYLTQKLIKPNKAVDTTAANAPSSTTKVSKSTIPDTEAMTNAAVVSP